MVTVALPELPVTAVLAEGCVEPAADCVEDDCVAPLLTSVELVVEGLEVVLAVVFNAVVEERPA